MIKVCERCGGSLGPVRKGPTPRYCSAACKQAAYRARKPKVPAEMRRRERWVNWKPVRRGDRITKVPTQLDGSLASSTDPATWTSYASLNGSERKGFVLGAGIGCIDLDHCLVDGVPTAAAAEFLAKLPPTYVEVSPSGDGLHVFGLVAEGPGRRRKVDGLSIETYSAGRYMTVTGKAFSGSVPRLADLSEFITA